MVLCLYVITVHIFRSHFRFNRKNKERKGWLVDVNVRGKIQIAQSLEMISVLRCAVQRFVGKIGTHF